ncbi:hypothetical protein JOF53_000511 [Crossiella equi]|uniref:Secreted protein n=1 Tax=Crossiella equi TaxID=130796 RepID=A0ABS5A600_9PSEU|nr:hypothetical protein [Crossiella equi]MBP2471639.1 hypothetical protein [Crossiella equi]
MRTSLFRIFIVLAALIAPLLTTSNAFAGQTRVHGHETAFCEEVAEPTYLCTVYAYNFPGGTMSIDADTCCTTGTSHWYLFEKSWRKCETDFRTEAPAQSWTCSGLPANNYKLQALILKPVPHPDNKWVSIGLRW